MWRNDTLADLGWDEYLTLFSGLAIDHGDKEACLDLHTNTIPPSILLTSQQINNTKINLEEPFETKSNH